MCRCGEVVILVTVSFVGRQSFLCRINREFFIMFSRCVIIGREMI